MRHSVSATSDAPAPGGKPGGPPESRLQRWGPLLFCIAASLPLLLPVLRPEVQLYYRDTLRLYFPVKKFVADELAQGRLPLWDPWTESGTSLLGQISPGLLHPFTLLYAALPFGLAFKLNHLLSLPLAALGAYAAARRLPAGRPAAAVAGVIYGGCGYLLSMASSNLPYALGAATLPWAIAGVLWLCEKPSAARLLLGASALALCGYAGEPQSALLGGLIGGLLALLLPLAGPAPEKDTSVHPDVSLKRELPRRLGLVAAWGAVALLLAGPALLPGALRLRTSSRWTGLTAEEKTRFELHPARLLGMALPRAFDDLTEDPGGTHEPLPFWEYFAGDRASFSDSSGLGLPALLLALFAALRERRGRWLVLGSVVFALAACGSALGVYGWLLRLVPGLGLFRYSEKLLGPCALLFAMAAARGAQLALSGTRREAQLLAGLSALASAKLGLLWALLHLLRAPLEAWLVTAGRKHDPLAAPALVELLLAALVTAGVLAAALALVALHRALSARGPLFSPLLAAGCCLAAQLAYGADLLHTASADLLAAPPPLAAELLRRGGPSEGKWRALFDETEAEVFRVPGADERFQAATGAIRLLQPQLDALFFESTQVYFSLVDQRYADALSRNTGNFAMLFGVRFLGAHQRRLTSKEWQQTTFKKSVEHSVYLREVEPGPRAFLVDRLFVPPPGQELEAVFGDPSFAPRAAAVVSREESALVKRVHPDGLPAGTATFTRKGPDQALLETSAKADRFLVVGEHFDAGWNATVDGHPTPVVAADGLALGLSIPAGQHSVVLRFWPRGLTAATVGAGLTLLVLVLLCFRERQRANAAAR